MRVTFLSQYRDAQASLESAASRFVDMQRQVASGKRVARASDDPSAAAAGIVERGDMGGTERYQRAADSVASRLTVVDTVLGDAIDQVSAAQTAATAARGSSKSVAEREASARKIESIRTALLEDFNTTFRGSYIFSGTKSTTRPYTPDPSGVVPSYAGSTTEVAVDVGPQRSVTIGYNGEDIAKGTDAVDVFAVLKDLADAARLGDNAALGQGITDLGNAFSRLTAAQGRVGQDMNAVDSERARLLQVHTAGEARLSKIEDANMAQAIPAMNQADAAYRSALGAIGKVSNVSLLDYLG